MVKNMFEGLAATFIASLLFIVLGLVYFMVNLWIVTTGAVLLNLGTIDASWAVLSATLLTVGSVLGSSYRK